MAKASCAPDGRRICLRQRSVISGPLHALVQTAPPAALNLVNILSTHLTKFAVNRLVIYLFSIFLSHVFCCTFLMGF